MPPRKRIEATVYVVDCTSNVEERLSLLNKFHTLKYFAQTEGAMKDLQRIILYNHPGLKSKHIVNDWVYYSFEVLKSIETQIEGANQDFRSHNFLFAINGAINAFKDDIIKQEYIKRIVFITDLSSSMDYDNTESKLGFIKQEMKEHKIWLYVVGLNIKIPFLVKQQELSKLNKIVPAGELTPNEKRNFAILSRIDKNVAFVDTENAVDVFFAHKIEPKTPFKWYVKMNVGPDLEIPVVVHRTTRTIENIKFYPCPSVPGQNVSNIRAWYDVNTHERVHQTDIVKGYKFQNKITEVTDELLTNIKKVPTQKCLTIFGYADADEAPVNMYIMSDSISCIKPDTRGRQSPDERRFPLFVKSLRVKKQVALAYRVYNNGNARKFFCIFPCPEHLKDEHLLMAQFPYQHEFLEEFVRGKVEEEATYKSDTFDAMSDFLDAVTPYDDENKKALYPLPPSMQILGSRARIAEYIGSKALGLEPGEAPTLKMHPVIERRASPRVDPLLTKILEN